MVMGKSDHRSHLPRAAVNFAGDESRNMDLGAGWSARAMGDIRIRNQIPVTAGGHDVGVEARA
jgi:hypothetical protein